MTGLELIGLANGGIDLAKKLYEGAKTAKNRELQELAMELRDVIFQLKGEIQGLSDQLKIAQEAQSETVEFGTPFSTFHGHPICPTCYSNKEKNKNPLSDAYQYNNQEIRRCQVCNSKFRTDGKPIVYQSARRISFRGI